MKIRFPAFLHEVLGEYQTPGELLAIILFGGGLTTILFFTFPEMTRGLPLWRGVIAYLLTLDIFAGCIANFTRSTNDHYAHRDRERLVFIALHVHILAVAWLLGTSVWQAVLVWIYTIAGALVVNALKGNPVQRFVGGGLLATGISLITLGTEFPKYFLVIALLFMMKVLFSFAVDHYAQ